MSNERSVSLGELSPTEATASLGREISRETTAEQVLEGAPKLTSRSFSGFRADYGVVEGNLVVHFYLPSGLAEALKKADPRYQQQWEVYWLRTFPDVLSPVAKRYFRADTPRIVAKYTEELASWWFCAKGFGDAIDPDALLLGFLQKMDEGLKELRH